MDDAVDCREELIKGPLSLVASSRLSSDRLVCLLRLRQRTDRGREGLHVWMLVKRDADIAGPRENDDGMRLVQPSHPFQASRRLVTVSIFSLASSRGILTRLKSAHGQNRDSA
jgi:hypothetical protein